MSNSEKNVIEVYTSKKRFPVAEDLYGLFFEEINRSGDGGLYAELLRNRSFEDSIPPKRCELFEEGMILKTPTGWKDQFNNGEGLKRWKRKYEPSPVPAWYADRAKIALNTENTLNKNREASLDVSFEKGGKIYNTGFNGIPVEKSNKYDFYMFARVSGEEAVNLSIYLEKDGRILTDIKKVSISGKMFKKYEFSTIGIATDYAARLCIRSDVRSNIQIGFISLMPTDTYKDHGLRKDLMEMLEKLNAKFLRFPGGCAVEGITKETSYSFRDTIGPVWERKSKQIPWHYRATNGIGYHEFLQMCEDLGVKAMYVVNCGLTCQARNAELFNEAEIDEWIQQACEAIDYAIANPETNEWGRKRMQAGHPEPFPLKYVEIGNENNHEPYYERYLRFYEVLKKKYPDLRFISNTHTERKNLPTEIVDEHFYNNTTFFTKGAALFDAKDRTEPPVFIGEYAVTCGADIANLKAAIAESAFMIEAENNQDAVILSAYAPLFSNVDYKSWHPNLIEFNNHKAFGIPGYYALAMLAANRGKDVLTVRKRTGTIFEKKIGRPGILTNASSLSLKNVLLNGKAVHASHVLSGEISESSDILCAVSGKPSYMSDFPGFAHNLKNYTFAVFGEEDSDRYVYEGNIRIDSPDWEVALTIHNYHSPQLAQIDETLDVGTEWAPDAVDFCSWTIQNGKSNVFSSHWFFNEPLAEEEEIVIPYGEYFHFKIEVGPDGFDCFMNGAKVQSAKFEQIPKIAVTASENEKSMIIKAVNFDDFPAETKICLDCKVQSEYILQRLGGMDGKTENSLDEPYKVVPVTEYRHGANKDFEITLMPNSLNIITLEKNRNE